MSTESMRTKIWLVRHGETDWNVAGRIQGQTDTPLSATGRRQARLLAEHLRGAGLTAIYSSDLQRASDTAGVVAQAVGLEPVARPDLRERAYGRWEGLTLEEAKAQWPDLVATWFEDFDSFCPPQGEGTLALRSRVLRAFRGIVAGDQGGSIAFVGHRGPLKEILCHALGIPPMARTRIRLTSTSVTVLSIESEVTSLELFNDTCHLRPMAPEAEAS